MRNHDQKAKDMAESILPSKQRGTARRDRRAIHSRHRAQQHAQLRRVLAYDGVTEFDPGLERRRSGAIRELVSDRRVADKSGSLERWARTRVQRDPALRELSLEDQVREFARLMPDNLIGRHATDHIRWGLEHEQRRARWRTRRAGDRRSDALVETVADLRRVLEAGAHRELNDGIRVLCSREAATNAAARRPWDLWTQRRLLAGIHDIEDFAAGHYLHRPVRELIARLARGDR